MRRITRNDKPGLNDDRVDTLDGNPNFDSDDRGSPV